MVLCVIVKRRNLCGGQHIGTLFHIILVALVMELLLVQPSSVAAERVFSFLNTLSAQQEGALEAKHFSSPETVVVRLTRQQKARTQMTTKAMGLCAKSRRAVDSKFGIVRMPQLKMLENVLKPKETATAHARKHFSRGLGRNWDENGQKRPFAA